MKIGPLVLCSVKVGSDLIRDLICHSLIELYATTVKTTGKTKTLTIRTQTLEIRQKR
jgi:hypothetical protein